MADIPVDTDLSDLSRDKELIKLVDTACKRTRVNVRDFMDALETFACLPAEDSRNIGLQLRIRGDFGWRNISRAHEGTVLDGDYSEQGESTLLDYLDDDTSGGSTGDR